MYISASTAILAFLHGVSRIIDMTGANATTDTILSTSDADALRSDWQAVGDDLRWAIREYEPTSPTLPTQSDE